MSRFGIYTASFVHAGGTLNLQQLDSQGLSTGSNVKTIRPGGAINPAAHILSTANPRARFSTTDIYTVLNAMGGAFTLACSGGHSMRYQKRLAGGAFDSGSNHYIQTTSKGMLSVGSIAADVDGDGASLDLEYIPLSSAGENPITDSASGSLGAVAAPAYTTHFYLGGVQLDDVVVPGLVRARAVPGNRIVARRSDGGVFARYDLCSIVARDPMLELTFLNAALPDAYTLFLGVLGVPIDLYLQRGTPAADGRVAAATTSHIKLSLADGSWGHDDISVSGEDDATTTVRIMGTGAMSATLNAAIG